MLETGAWKAFLVLRVPELAGAAVSHEPLGATGISLLSSIENYMKLQTHFCLLTGRISGALSPPVAI